MNFEAMRTNPAMRVAGALALGVALDYLTGYARHFTAPLFISMANSVLGPESLPQGIILVNSAHALVAGLIASVMGLLLLVFIFRIENMFLPLVSCVSFALTTNWWFYSALPEIFEQVDGLNLLVALSGHTSAILAWLLASWILVTCLKPDKIYLWGKTLMLGREHETDQH